jgi:hypothetical protein
MTAWRWMKNHPPEQEYRCQEIVMFNVMDPLMLQGENIGYGKVPSKPANNRNVAFANQNDFSRARSAFFKFVAI